MTISVCVFACVCVCVSVCVYRMRVAVVIVLRVVQHCISNEDESSSQDEGEEELHVDEVARAVELSER